MSIVAHPNVEEIRMMRPITRLAVLGLALLTIIPASGFAGDDDNLMLADRFSELIKEA